MIRRTGGFAAVCTGVLVVCALVAGVGVVVGSGGESLSEQGAGTLESVELQEDTEGAMAPSKPGKTDGGGNDSPVAENETHVEQDRGADGSDFDNDVTNVSLDELGTLTEPGIYQTDVSDFDTIELDVLGPGGGGAGYVSDGNGGVKDGGSGGAVNGTWDVSDFDQITVTIGEGGGGGDALFGNGTGGGGYFDGGDGGFDDDDTAGGGGGGATVVEGVEFSGDSVLLAAAGGGGGGAAWNQSGGVIGEPTVESAGGGGGPGGAGGSTSTVGGSDGDDAEDSNGPIDNDIGAPGGDAGDTSADPGGIGGWWVNTTYAQDWNGNVGGGASGGEGGATFDGELGDPGDDGSVDITTPNVVVQSTSAPSQVQAGENLTVSYTLEETNGVEAEESFVDLDINGTLEEFDSSVTVPAGGTTSGSLTFTNTENYDNLEWCIELFDFGGQDCGTTSIPDISIQSANGPSEIAPGDDLTVDYTLENNGGGGEESFVDLYVDGTLEEFDSNVFVPGGGTTSDSLTFGDTGGYSNGDTIDWSVELFDFGGTVSGTTDVVVPPEISITSVSAPDKIGIEDNLLVDYTLENTGGDGTESSVDLLIGGTSEDSNSDVFVPGGGSNSGTLVYDTVQSDYDYGETIDWTVSLSDAGDTSSGSTDIEAAPPEFQVTIQSTNAPVTEGQTLSVEAKIENVGGKTDEQTVELQVAGLGVDSSSVSLASGSSTTRTLSIVTDSGDAGTYSAEVSSENDTKSTGVEVLTPATFGVTITGTNDPIIEGDRLDVVAEIQNTGDVDGTQTVDLVVNGLGSNSTGVTLGPGDSTTETLSVDTTSGDGGEYTAEVSTDNDTDTASVTVEQGSVFDVLIVSTTDPVEGNPVQVDVQVTNTGDTGDTQSVTMSVGALGSESKSLTLSSGDSVTRTFTVGTTSGDAGEYTAEVSSEDDNDSVPVSVKEQATFEVAITGTNDPLAGESLDVTTEITNTGGVQDTQTITLDVGALGNTSISETLVGGDSRSRTLSLDTSPGDGGEYTAEVTSEDDTATTGVSVLAPASLAVTIQSTAEPVEGERLAVDAKIANTGDIETTQTVSLAVPGLGTNTTELTLSGNESTVETLSVATAPGEAGTYTANVSSDDDFDTAAVDVLDAAEFAVTVTGANDPLEGEPLAVGAEIQNTGDAGATGNVQLDVPGLGSNATSVTLGGGNSTAVNLSVDTAAGDAGNYTATISTDSDSDTADVTVLADATFAVAITGTTEPVEGTELGVTAEIQNTGDVRATQTVELDVPGLGTNSTDLTLDGDESSTETLTVDTTSGDAGTYTATVASADTTDSRQVTVLAQAGFQVSIVSAGDPIEGNPLTVDVSVENVGDVQETQTVSLDAGALGSNSTDVTLSGGNSTVETLSVGTSDGDAGSYTVNVTSEDDQDTTTVQVLGAATFEVSITEAGDPLEGAPLAVGVEVENTGDVEATQAVELDVGSLGTDDTAVTLGPGNTTNETLTVGTQAGDAGNYTATVSSDDDSATTEVTVLAPPEFNVSVLGVNTASSVLDVTYEVHNTGDIESTQTISFSVDGAVEGERELTLGANGTVQDSFSYGIVAGDAPELAVEVASPDDSDSQTVSVAAGALSLNILDVNTSVVEGETLSVVFEAENTGDEPVSESVELLDFDGALVDSTSVDLAGGETTQATLDWATEAGDAGSGNVTVDSQTATAQTRAVEVLAPAEFTVEILGANEPVEGESLEVTVSTENVGDIEDTQSIGLDVGALGSNSTQVTLSGGESTTEVLAVGTTEGDAGGYTATVTSADDSTTQAVTVLTQASFSVGITGASEPVAGESLTVTAEITNTGGTEDTQTLTLDVPGLGTDSTAVTLAGNTSTVETFSVATDAGDAGSYTATVASEDSQDSQTVTVLEQAKFTVEIVDAADVVAGDNLTVTANVTNTGDVETEQTVTLAVGNLGQTSTSVQLPGDASTTETLALATAAGDAGTYTAELSSDDDTDTAQVSVLEQATFEVAITDASDPVEGDPLTVTAEVTNVGEVQGGQTVTVDVPGLGSNQTDVVLGANESTAETVSIATDAGDAGTYTAEVSSANDTDTAQVTVRQQAEFAVDIVGTGEPVEGEVLTVTASIQNTGDVEDTQTVTLDVGALGANSTDVTLGGGNTTEETLSVATAAGDAGTYTATVESDDDSASTGVTVLAEATLAVSVDAAPDVVEGENLSVTVSVENTGEVEATQTVTLDVPGLGSDDIGVSLAGGASTTETLAVGTAAGDAGNYTATVDSDDDSASTGVRVLAAPEVTVDITGTSVAGSVLNVSYEAQNAGEVEDTQTVTFDVDGTTEDQREYTLGGGESVQASFDYDIVAGDAPELAVTVGSADDSATQEVSIAPATLSLSILDVSSSAAASVVEGENLSVSIEAENVGDEPAAETVELLDIDGAPADNTSVDLVGGETTQRTLVWATEPGDAGSGNVTVDSPTASAQTRAVEVLAPQSFGVEILGAATPVEGDTLSVTISVENTGDIGDTQTIGLDVGALGSNSTQVSLPGGASTQETLSVGTEVGQAGEYTATVSSDNDTVSQEVMLLEEAALAVSILETGDPVAGENLTVTAEITNTGDTQDSQTVSLDVPGLGTDETNVTVGANDSTTETFSVDTGQGDAGVYNATVETEDTADTEEVTVLDPAAFSVAVTTVADVVAGEDVVVTASVENTGDVTDTRAISLDLGALGKNSTNVSLAGGASTEVALSVATSPGDVGVYTATVASPGDSDSAQVAVLEPPAFEVTVVEMNEPVEGGTLVVTATITNTGEAAATQTVTLDVPGLGGDQTDVVLGAGNVTNETFSVDTEEGDAGSYTATVASEDDQDSTNLTVLAQAGFAVDIVEAGDPVAGEDLEVTVDVTNTGDVETTQPVELDVGALGTDTTAVTLQGNESIEKTLSVATEPTDAGTYTATVSSQDDTDSQNVTVLQQGALLVDIVDASEPVEGDNLTLTANLTNTGDVETTQTVTLDVAGLGTDAVEVTLGAGASTERVLAVGTGPGDAGTYTAEISSEDDTDTASVTVLEPAGFSVTITATNEPVAGEQLTVTTTVNNTGASTGTQTVTLDVGALGSNSTTVELAGGESTETTLSVDTATDAVGTYTAEVTSEDDSDETTVTVLSPEEFVVDILEMPDTVIENSSMTMTVEVENVGEAVGTQSLSVQMEGHDGIEIPVTLGAGESVQKEMELSMAAQKLGNFTVTAVTADDTDQETVQVRLPTLPGQEGPPNEIFDDGYYEDVDGDGAFNIFDIQTLFNHLDAPEVQEHGWAYDFNNDGSVTIFDVQALFNRL